MVDDGKKRDEAPAGAMPPIEVGPAPTISLGSELNRTLETVLDEESQERMREAAEAARQSVTIVNAPDAAPDERRPTARELSARFRDDDIDEAGRGGGALGRAVARERASRLLSLAVLVVVTAVAALLILRWLRRSDSAPAAPPSSASSALP